MVFSGNLLRNWMEKCFKVTDSIQIGQLYRVVQQAVIFKITSMTEAVSSLAIKDKNAHLEYNINEEGSNKIQGESFPVDKKSSSSGHVDHKNGQNPELGEKKMSKRRKILIGVVITIAILGIITGVILGVITSIQKPTFSSEVTATYHIAGTNQTMKVHSWRYQKTSIVGPSLDIKGQKVTFHPPRGNRLLQGQRHLQNSGQEEINYPGYVVMNDEEAGVTVKYFGEGNYAVEVDPHQNFIYYDKAHGQASRRLQTYLNVRNLQYYDYEEDPEDPDADFLHSYFDDTQQAFSEQSGTEPQWVGTGLAPSYKGSEQNGQFTIEHNQQSSRLLQTLIKSRGLTKAEKKEYLKNVSVTVQQIAQKHIDHIKVGCWMFCHFKIYIGRRLQKQTYQSDQKEEKNDISGDQCRPLSLSSISHRAWKIIQNCSVHGSNWVCTKKEWFSIDTPFKRSADCKKHESEYRTYNRFISYFKKREGRDCAS